MNKETEGLVKDLFMFYAERHIDSADKNVCWGCFATAEIGEKVKHEDSCEVVVMRKRIKAIMEAYK